MGMGFELADEGEVYMICQGAGGGYGDVLERDPDAVVADVEAGYISHQTARDIYFVGHDPDTLAVDVAGTERPGTPNAARLGRGRPYAEFVKDWVTPEPPAHLPYYGSWGPTTTSSMRPPGARTDQSGYPGRSASCRRSSCPTRTCSRSAPAGQIAELEADHA